MDSKLEDDFWNTSSSSTFNFDDEEDTDSVELNFNAPVKEATHLPIHSIILKNSLSTILNDIRIHESLPPPVEETIKKIFYGFNYNLESYKSLNDKISLLDAAINSYDGNIILRIILFMKKTLKSNIFLNEISKNKIATRHYINYLISKNNLQELADVYIRTGNTKRMGDLYYLSTRNITNPKSLKQKLDQFMTENSQLMQKDEKNHFISNSEFLGWQIKYNENSNSIIEQLAKLAKDIIKNKGNFDNLYVFKNQFHIDDFQFEWTVLNAFCCLKEWEMLKEFFIKPAWLTKKTSLKSVIKPNKFILSMSRYKPPKDILEQFLPFITDSQQNLFIALKLNLYRSVINYFVNQRDRLALLEYKEKVPQQSEEYLLIENALICDRKWKN